MVFFFFSKSTRTRFFSTRSIGLANLFKKLLTNEIHHYRSIHMLSADGWNCLSGHAYSACIQAQSIHRSWRRILVDFQDPWIRCNERIFYFHVSQQNSFRLSAYRYSYYIAKCEIVNKSKGRYYLQSGFGVYFARLNAWNIFQLILQRVMMQYFNYFLRHKLIYANINFFQNQKDLILLQSLEIYTYIYMRVK